MRSDLYILGINAYHGDSSACLVKNGELIAAVEEERFRRIKHWAGIPSQAINFCLETGGISLKDLDYIAINRDPRANLFKKIVFALKRKPSLTFLKSRTKNLIKIKDIKLLICEALGVKPEDIRAKLCFVEHHRAHLASSFFVSPFKEAALISVDGFGDFVSTMLGKGDQNEIKVLSEVNYPHSLGAFYTAITQYLGFTNYGDEFKVMGLAALGKPTYLSDMEKIVRLEENGRFSLDLKFFQHYGSKGAQMSWENQKPQIGQLYSSKLIDLLGPARGYKEELTQKHKDIAASLQAMYEKAFFHLLNYLYERTGCPNLCVAGGCALNSVANGKLFDYTSFREVYIQPAAGDAGGAIGAAYYLYNQILGNPRKFIMTGSYWGNSYTDEEVSEVIERDKAKLATLHIQRAKDEELLVQKTVECLVSGNVVGWFQGRMEWGPRALGNRSILVDPRKAEMKDVLNARIKRREAFRPFAPSILLEKTGEYFEKDYPDPFMLKVYPIKEDKRKIIPATTHLDGTGRLQTVSPEENPLYWRLIKKFEEVTGVPVLLNTSFNENEPVVCKLEEAIDCFLRTKMDVLVLGSFIITKQKV
ncbi:MAG: carbamoyltransferase [Candidatus Saganbacteria bacterium]|nr:carbamoyltransferase [Candidatus Saganbacteria bacterium]